MHTSGFDAEQRQAFDELLSGPSTTSATSLPPDDTPARSVVEERRRQVEEFAAMTSGRLVEG